MAGMPSLLEHPAGWRDPIHSNHAQRMSRVRVSMDGLGGTLMTKVLEGEEVLSQLQSEVLWNTSLIKDQTETLKRLDIECIEARERRTMLRQKSKFEEHRLRKIKQEIEEAREQLEMYNWQQEVCQEQKQELASLKQEFQEMQEGYACLLSTCESMQKDINLLNTNREALISSVDKLCAQEQQLYKNMKLSKELIKIQLECKPEVVEDSEFAPCTPEKVQQQKSKLSSSSTSPTAAVETDTAGVCCEVVVVAQQPIGKLFSSKDQQLLKSKSFKLVAAKAKAVCKKLLSKSSSSSSSSKARGSSAGDTASRRSSLFDWGSRLTSARWSQ